LALRSAHGRADDRPHRAAQGPCRASTGHAANSRQADHSKSRARSISAPPTSPRPYRIVICRVGDGEIVRRVDDRRRAFQSGPLTPGDYTLVANGVSTHLEDRSEFRQLPSTCILASQRCRN
jgi:hypothetical protein